MCDWNDNVILTVPIPADLSYTGEFRWDEKPIDRCLAPIIQALNNVGAYTASCCCGHGKNDGSIVFHNGDEFIMKNLQHQSLVEKLATAMKLVREDFIAMRNIDTGGIVPRQWYIDFVKPPPTLPSRQVRKHARRRKRGRR